MHNHYTYQIFPLGDSAITVDFGNTIDENINNKVLSLFRSLQQKPVEGMVEAVPAYSSITIIYDPVHIRKIISRQELAFTWIKKRIETFLQTDREAKADTSRLIRVPVCYDESFGTDLRLIAAQKKISIEEIIRLHTGCTYRIFMLGFLPGFPYLGGLDAQLETSRKQQPQMVSRGSVAIAGRQTGIYSLASPGGWNIIGRTPVILFDAKKDSPALFKAGDQVEFFPVSKEAFYHYQHEYSNH
jgi:inhibitor of KinA